jgi:hypothetical protein
MDKYMAQQPKFIQGHLGVAKSLGAGENITSFDNLVSTTLGIQHCAGKIALAAPARKNSYPCSSPGWRS